MLSHLWHRKLEPRCPIFCIQFEYRIRKIFYRKPSSLATSTVHQVLMQGSKRHDEGWTVDDAPNTEAAFEASNEMALLWYAVLQ